MKNYTNSKDHFSLREFISLLAILTFILCIKISFSQQVPFQQWSNVYNNPAGTNDYILKMASDNNGNIYITGRSDSAQVGSWGKTLTVKYNSNGSVQWAKNFTNPLNRASTGDGGMSLAADNSGNVYVLASITTSPNFNSAVVIKYNSSGDTVWTKRVADTTDYYTGGGEIKVDGSGNIYAAVINASFIHTAYISVVKLNSSGATLWQTDYTGPSGNHGSSPRRMILDASGNVFVVGRTSVLGYGSFYWGDGVALKISSGGIIQWSATYDGAADANDWFNDLALDASGNLYATGIATLVVNSQNMVVAKYDGNTGGLQWVKNPVGTSASPYDYGYGIKVNASGDVYVAGLLTNTVTGYDAEIIKFNTSGNEQWRKAYPNNNNEVFNAMVLDASGNIYATGNSAGPGGVYSITAKYNSTGDMLWSAQYNPGISTNSGFIEILPDNSLCIAGSQGNTSYDLFTAKYMQVTAQSTTICKSINKPIHDFQSTYDTINVSGISPTAQIIDVQVKIDTIIHTYVYDLTGTLKGPSGLNDTLFKSPGKPVTGFNMIGCNITDTASHLLDTSATAPFTGFYKPYKSLSAFSGNNPNGAWILNVYDGAGGDTGYVKKYCITISYFDPATIGIHTITNEIPKDYSLGQNYPNPFNPTTNIKFSIPQTGLTKLVVYDILGRQVAVLVNEFKQSGTYKVDFDASHLASGVYFYKLESSDFSKVKKMVLIK